MKNRKRLTILMILINILFLSFQTTVQAKSTDHSTILDLQNSISKLNRNSIDKCTEDFSQEDPTWYPGFLIVQLVKGILAFVVILLILFDIIEPEK